MKKENKNYVCHQKKAFFPSIKAHSIVSLAPLPPGENKLLFPHDMLIDNLFFSYHKITRAKDVSNYSAEDISSILGVKKTKKETPPPEIPVQSSNNIINAGSITDYFNAKMLKLKQSKITPQDDTSNLIEDKTTSGNSDIAEDVQDECKETKKRKKEKKKKTCNLTDIEVNSEDLPTDSKEAKKKKKKTDNMVTSEDLPTDCKETKKKKKKKSSDHEVTEQNESNSESTNFFQDKMNSIYSKVENTDNSNSPPDTTSTPTLTPTDKRTRDVGDEYKKSKRQKKEKTEKNKQTYESITGENEVKCEDNIHTFFSAKMLNLYSKTD